MTEPDDASWLTRYSPREWMNAAMAELDRARTAYAQRNGRAGLAGCRRAAGCALNAMLRAQPSPDPRYGRSFMDHLAALSADEGAPQAVRDAAGVLRGAVMPGGPVVVLRTPHGDARELSAAEDVMAHGLVFVLRAEAAAEAERSPD